ncbi:unnamed protein product [Mesocestoides corti]|uniref:PID domain-containing protein n=1 Tax=Mesocestoides corti TaxID=53468 RepID=A0A0R3UHP3_MESCO|nr:unnamed protein product [Mesocestoides corti]
MEGNAVVLKRPRATVDNSHQSTCSEYAIYLGTEDVPNRQGNELCYYAYLLITKLNEAGNRKVVTVKVCADHDGITARDKNHNVKISSSLDDLTYVWVHPQEPRILGIITTCKDQESSKPASKFTAFRMSSKAKKFAHRLQRVYCEYMDGLQAKLSSVSMPPNLWPVASSGDLQHLERQPGIVGCRSLNTDNSNSPKSVTFTWNSDLLLADKVMDDVPVPEFVERFRLKAHFPRGEFFNSPQSSPYGSS